MYLSAATIRKRFEISRTCLTDWANKGHVRVRRINGRKRLYHIRDVEQRLGGGCPADDKKKVIYARVSSTKQKEDLKRQVDDLKGRYPDHDVYKDIGSGLNFKRKRFEALLDGIFHETISEIVVAYRDRLCRYGFELFENFCRHHDTKIVVCDQRETPDDRTELAEDLLAVCNFFVARNNGRRGGRQTSKRKKIEAEFDPEVEVPVREVDGNRQVDVQPVPEELQGEEVQDEQVGLQVYGFRVTQPRNTQEENGEEEEEAEQEQGELEEETLGNSARDKKVVYIVGPRDPHGDKGLRDGGSRKRVRHQHEEAQEGQGASIRPEIQVT